MYQPKPLGRRWGRRLTLAGLLALWMPAMAFAQGLESYAVIDLEGRGISTIEAQTLTDRMRSELVKTGAVTVVERGQMQQILGEQDFQLTGCTSDECAVEIGQMLGVTKMVAGSIGKIGSTYTVDLRNIDVATGAILTTMTRNYRGEIDGLLTQIERISWELVGLVHPDELLEQLQGAPGLPQLPDVAAGQQPRRGGPEPAAEDGEKQGGRGMLWIVLLAVAGGGAVAIALAGGDTPPDDGGGGGEGPDTIGSPPNFPTPP